MTINALRRSALLTFALLSAAFDANATLQASGTTTVINLRVEGPYGFIGYNQPVPNCGDRVWVDMTTVLGRAAYATAMLALSMGKPVVVRAYDESTRVFGTCNLYDIYVTQ